MAKKILLNLGLLLLFIITGCLGGALFGSSSGGPGSTTWKQMTPPPEKPVRIVEIGGYSGGENSITVQSAANRQYECCKPGPSPWTEVTSPKTRYGPECRDIQSTLFDQLSGKIVDCAFISQFEYTTEQYYAAVMDDGSIWRWHYVSGLIPFGNAVITGTLAGFILGIIVVVYRIITDRNKDGYTNPDG
jgi:hypothetical protein